MKRRKSKPKKKMREPAKTGRRPERLKIEGSWKDAVGRALKRGKPKPETDDQK